MDPSSIDLDVERNVLTVKAEHTPTYRQDVELQAKSLTTRRWLGFELR